MAEPANKNLQYVERNGIVRVEKVEPVAADGCLQSNSCGGQAPSGCFCDPFCSAFGDCCPDGPC